MLFSSLSVPGSSADSVLTLSISNNLGDTKNATYSPLRIVSPLVQEFFPKFGPEAGGTRIRVSGVGLGVGTTRSVAIIGISNCIIVTEPSNLDGNLVCVTEPAVISKGNNTSCYCCCINHMTLQDSYGSLLTGLTMIPRRDCSSSERILRSFQSANQLLSRLVLVPFHSAGSLLTPLVTLRSISIPGGVLVST